MNKSFFTRVAQLIFVFIVSLTLFGCGGDENIIESSDGIASLEIPDGALPEGVEMSDLSITPLVGDELPFVPAEGESLIAYKLEPSGTEFLEDITLATTMDYVEGALPTLLLIDRDKIEHVQSAEIEISKQTNKLTVKSQIPHFSIFAQSYGSVGLFIKIDSTASADFIGEPVTGSATITASSEPYTSTKADGPTFTWNLVPGSVRVDGKLRPGGSAIGPDTTFEDRPAKTTIDGSLTVPGDGYTCEEEGEGYLLFRFNFNWDVYHHASGGLPGYTAKDHYRGITIETDPVECKPVPECGDGIINQSPEQCDKYDFGGKTCADYGYPAEGGYLLCDAECQVDTSGCIIMHALSCNENTWEDETGTWDNWTCEDDCPDGQICDAESCSCIANTAGVPDEGLGETVGGEEVVEKKVTVLLYLLHHIPIDQLQKWPATDCKCCDEEHWHAKAGTVTTLKGEVLTDPYKDCGFGKVSQMSVLEVNDPR